MTTKKAIAFGGSGGSEINGVPTPEPILSLRMRRDRSLDNECSGIPSKKSTLENGGPRDSDVSGRVHAGTGGNFRR
jgi:hypothetical protein